jgi:predicted nucleic acid-binding protein
MKDIANKTNVRRKHVEAAIEQLLAQVNSVPAAEYMGYLSESLEYVRDEGDAPFVALALAKSPSIIVTYNKKHFKFKPLARRGITVLTPVEAVRLHLPAEGVD